MTKEKDRDKLERKLKMEVKRLGNIAKIFSCLLLVALFQCTPKSQLVKEDEATILRRRVQEYWSYRVKGELDKSYLYESPEYREKINLVSYINQLGRSPMKWQGFDILELWTTGEEGHVKLNTKYRYLLPQTAKAVFERMADEEWIKKGGEWYRRSPVI